VSLDAGAVTVSVRGSGASESANPAQPSGATSVTVRDGDGVILGTYTTVPSHTETITVDGAGRASAHLLNWRFNN
jgi:hypothetical protein